jgi:hypothetical protein
VSRYFWHLQSCFIAPAVSELRSGWRAEYLTPI